MSARVSRSNRIAQPSQPGILAPGLQKLSLRKGVPVFIITFDDLDGSEYILTFDDIDTNEYILTAGAA